MADTLISALTQLTAVDSADECVIVDKSDTTMAASGTTKRVVVGDLLTMPAVAVGTTPTTPTGAVRLFDRTVGGRHMPAWVGPSGLDTSVQASLARNKIGWVQPNGNSTVLGVNGLALTAAGTATTAAWAVTSLHTSMRRLDYLVTTAATTAVAGFRGAAAQFWRGNAAGLGGFHFVCRWAPTTGQVITTKRAFCGMRGSTAAPTDVQPSSMVSICGMGWDSADTNVQFMINDASGTATKVDLGSGFAIGTTDRAKVYEIAMFCAPNGSNVMWEVTDLSTGASATGTASSDLPPATTALNPYAYISVGGTSSVIGLALMGLYIETDQ